MASVKVDGMKELERKIMRLAQWSEKDAQKLRAIDERVAEVYNVALRANIKDSPVDVKVYRSQQLRQTIKPGTLRRSVKTFRRSNKRITLAGPKTTGKRGGNKKVNRQDGWFASIVENGSGFGPGRNRGVFERTQKATKGRMQKLRNRLLQREFQRYMR
jgi:hypothetical protein